MSKMIISKRVYLKIYKCRGKITLQRALRGLHTITGFRKIDLQKQPPRGVPRRCSENMQQIYRRTTMEKCDLNKVALQLY